MQQTTKMAKFWARFLSCIHIFSTNQGDSTHCRSPRCFNYNIRPMRFPTAYQRDGIIGAVMVSGAALLTLTMLFAGYYLPPEKGELGVVFPPWMDEAASMTAVIRAGGSIAAATRFSNIIIAVAPDTGFSHRVREQGAWLTTAARGLCTPLEGEQI